MSNVHLTTMGAWLNCERGEDCTLRFHVPDMTPEQMQGLPYSGLLILLEVVDPPQLIMSDGTKLWVTSHKRMHRDHDLPAAIHADGTLEWFWNGRRHRDLGKPAVINIDGSVEYWQHGRQVLPK